MMMNLNKKISQIQYNLLNLPQNITYSTGSTIAYTYNAAGRKLRVAYGSPSSTIDYCGNMIYENGTLKQRYKYNGKEFDMMHGLHWYDYGARHYDPSFMRFTTMDPMCEKYYNLSPYAYCGNNPVNYVDTEGAEPTTYEAALMAKHVYGDNVSLVGGWHISKIQFASFNTNSGLKSALYERNNDYGTEYAYVTAGTQDFRDLVEDIGQLIGKGEQYGQSIKNAFKLKEFLNDAELTFVGHSLGGGLATANALATDKNAITFNAAAITTSTKKHLNLPSSTHSGRIFNIVVNGEIVNFLQSKIGLKLEGGYYNIQANYLPNIGIFNSINTGLRITNHSIDTIIQELEKENK